MQDLYARSQVEQLQHTINEMGELPGGPLSRVGFPCFHNSFLPQNTIPSAGPALLPRATPASCNTSCGAFAAWQVADWAAVDVLAWALQLTVFSPPIHRSLSNGDAPRR